MSSSLRLVVEFLGTFVNFRKKITVMFVVYFLLQLCKPTWNKSIHIVQIFMKLVLRNISIIWRGNACLYQSKAEISGTLHIIPEHVFFYNFSLNSLRKFETYQIKVADRIKYTFHGTLFLR